MEDIEVYVAFRNGVAHVLPPHATKLISTLGAKPAKHVNVSVHKPEAANRSENPVYLGTRGFVAGGSSVKQRHEHERFEMWWLRLPEEKQPTRSWKYNRRQKWLSL